MISSALGTARSQQRHLGLSIDCSVPLDAVLKVLDNLTRAEPDLLVAQWYALVSDDRITKLERDWKLETAIRTKPPQNCTTSG